MFFQREKVLKSDKFHISSRGGYANQHPGNKSTRKVARAHIGEYLETKKAERGNVARHVYFKFFDGRRTFVIERDYFLRCYDDDMQEQTAMVKSRPGGRRKLSAERTESVLRANGGNVEQIRSLPPKVFILAGESLAIDTLEHIIREEAGKLRRRQHQDQKNQQGLNNGDSADTQEQQQGPASFLPPGTKSRENISTCPPTFLPHFGHGSSIDCAPRPSIFQNCFFSFSTNIFSGTHHQQQQPSQYHHQRPPQPPMTAGTATQPSLARSNSAWSAYSTSSVPSSSMPDDSSEHSDVFFPGTAGQKQSWGPALPSSVPAASFSTSPIQAPRRGVLNAGLPTSPLEQIESSHHSSFQNSEADWEIDMHADWETDNLISSLFSGSNTAPVGAHTVVDGGAAGDRTADAPPPRLEGDRSLAVTSGPSDQGIKSQESNPRVELNQFVDDFNLNFLEPTPILLEPTNPFSVSSSLQPDQTGSGF